MRHLFVIAAWTIAASGCTTTATANPPPAAVAGTPETIQKTPEAAANPQLLEGSVFMTGSAPNARPVLEAGKATTALCSGDQRNYLAKFSGTVVSLDGSWSQEKHTKEKCFDIKSIKLLQINKGRPAVIGHLQKEDKNKQTILTADDGKQYILESPSKGVRGLTGKKVALDLNPSEKMSADGSVNLWKVVSYMEFPSP